METRSMAARRAAATSKPRTRTEAELGPRASKAKTSSTQRKSPQPPSHEPDDGRPKYWVVDRTASITDWGMLKLQTIEALPKVLARCKRQFFLLYDKQQPDKPVRPSLFS